MFTESIEMISIDELKENLQGLDPQNTIFLCDSNTKTTCFDLLDLTEYSVITIPAGEESKSMDSCNKIWSKMLELNLDRQATIVNIGGGVITDLGAFCASVFKRGCSFIQVPTSLMAMVDASIGGKTAVNFGDIKNPLGTFADAEDIYICTDFLDTLPKEEIINGYAECVKHALIYSNTMWEEIKSIQNIDKDYIKQKLQAFLQVKLDIVEEDPFEMGERKLLNFGHTIGHAIEAYSMEKGNTIKHGEAVAIGMYCEAHISLQHHYLDQNHMSEIANLLQTLFPKKEIDVERMDSLLSKIKNDKKASLGSVSFTLLENIGKGIINQTVLEDEIIQSIQHYNTNY